MKATELARAALWRELPLEERRARVRAIREAARDRLRPRRTPAVTGGTLRRSREAAGLTAAAVGRAMVPPVSRQRVSLKENATRPVTAEWEDRYREAVASLRASR